MTTRESLARWWPHADQAAWAKAIATADIFSERSRCGRWRDATWRSVAAGYTRWLKHVGARGSLKGTPAERVTPESVADFVAALKRTTTPWSQCGYMYRLYYALMIMAPEQDWTWLNDIAVSLQRVARATRRTDHVVPADQLYGLGRNLMERAEKDPDHQPIKKALLYRDGLMIALLAARPIRRKNLSGLRLGKQITKAGALWILCLQDHETKTRRAFELSLPPDLTLPIDRYLDRYRPRFFGASKHDGFWPTHRGTPLDARGMYKVIIKHTKSAFGTGVGPNLFRVSAATTMALGDPLHAEAAKLLLGQTHPGVMERHYNRARTIDASRRYQGHLDALRERLACGELGRQD